MYFQQNTVKTQLKAFWLFFLFNNNSCIDQYHVFNNFCNLNMQVQLCISEKNGGFFHFFQMKL